MVLPKKDKKNPARKSLNKFGGMIKRNIIKPAMKAASSANFGGAIVNATQKLPEYGQQIQEGIKTFDEQANRRFKENPGHTIGTQRGIIGPTYPESRVSIAEPNIPLKDLPGGKLPEGNVEALMGENQKAPLVNLAETATKQPGYVSPQEVKNIRTAKDSNTGVYEKPDIGGARIPDNYIGTKDGWQPKGNVLPGNEFSEANTQDYFKQTGYLKDADPKMVKRREEAQQVQDGRERFIKNSEAGMYNAGQSSVNMVNTKPTAKPARPDFSTGNSSFDRRHAASQRAAETAAMNANIDLARLGNTAGIAAGEQAVDRERIASNEGITNANRNMTASQNEYERQKYQQGRVDKSNEFDAKISNQIGQSMNHPDFWKMKNRIDKAASPEEKQLLESKFQEFFNFPSVTFDNFINKKTVSNSYDDMTLPISPKG